MGDVGMWPSQQEGPAGIPAAETPRTRHDPVVSALQRAGHGRLLWVCKDTRTNVHGIVVCHGKQPGSMDGRDDESLDYGKFVQWDPGDLTINK